MVALAALILDLADSGKPVTLRPGQALVLRLETDLEAWWSLDYDPAIVGRDHLGSFEAHPRGRTQVVELRARKPGTTRLRALRAKGTTRPTAEFELIVEVLE